ncbi:hypothetical protein K2173_018861 [Erythroxylum novogranatense]|uniref:B box-type domain-containing protein n=1 Tax=Erythroxylum novogranatense TaxID=1862640 RepID=A0AAV8SB64_9ROSI|nr:hypothetical protein K2173_018861 [Erythroxylum novogranatense]
MKSCELCKLPARTYCESDQASLCWDCDAKIHDANFLVARHSRALLCQTCQAVTPWRATGVKLGRTVSVCERCTHNSEEQHEEEKEDDDEEEEESDGSDGNDLESDLDGEGDNQVVPWSSVTPAPVTSSSSCNSSTSNEVSLLESMNADSMKTDLRSFLHGTVKQPFSEGGPSGDGEATFFEQMYRPFKCPRTGMDRTVRAGCCSAVVVDSLRKYHPSDKEEPKRESEAVDDLLANSRCKS